ncbi:UNVERIFIED_CONTAM: hypothetical protein Sangu_2906500 [Sesamum angustifolium]|uniref:Uncharacterized protein n=1 Tax=Sesamum angustifolium TaxID=2727405 RepID=A0AAW2ILG0_9LAMI
MDIAEKLSICQDTLRGWSSRNFRASKGRVKSLENRLQRLLASRLNPAVQEEISSVRKEVEGWAAREETKWRQRSKDVWLKEGDRNTSFFHRRASNRFQTNLIRKFKRRMVSGWNLKKEFEIALLHITRKCMPLADPIGRT